MVSYDELGSRTYCLLLLLAYYLQVHGVLRRVALTAATQRDQLRERGAAPSPSPAAPRPTSLSPTVPTPRNTTQHLSSFSTPHSRPTLYLLPDTGYYWLPITATIAHYLLRTTRCLPPAAHCALYCHPQVLAFPMNEIQGPIGALPLGKVWLYSFYWSANMMTGMLSFDVVPVEGEPMQRMHHSLLTTYCSLLATGCLPPFNAYYSLLTTHYSLLTSHYLPLTTHHSPPTAHHLPHTTHCSPLTTHHSLFTAHSLLLTTHYPQLTPHSALLTPHHSPPTAKETLS